MSDWFDDEGKVRCAYFHEMDCYLTGSHGFMNLREISEAYLHGNGATNPPESDTPATNAD